MKRGCECGAAREALWPPEKPRLVAVDVEEAARHVESCDECLRLFALDRRLRPAVEALRSQKAPLDLRERVFDALAQARAAPREVSPSFISPRVRPNWLLVAAALLTGLLVFVLGPGLLPPARAVATEALIADDYLRRAVAADRRVTDDPGEVTAFLLRELGVRVTPLSAPGLTLEQVEICLLEGRRSGLIQYRFQGKGVSHYVVPTDRSAREVPTVAEPTSAGVDQGLPVVSWSLPRLDQALVGDLASEVLLELASTGS